MTGAVAAVVLVSSLASIVILVDRIDTHHSLMSKVGSHEDETVVKLALTAVITKAYGNLKVTFAVPVVIAVVSSEHAITNDSFAAFTQV
jgi:hypothetical protein